MSDILELAGLLTPLYLFCGYFVIRTEHRLTTLETHCKDTHGGAENNVRTG